MGNSGTPAGGKKAIAEGFKTKGNWEDSDDYKEFRKNNMQAFKKAGIRSNEVARQEWFKTRLKTSNKSLKETSVEDAIQTIKDNVKASYMDGWFRSADSDYKPKILDAMMMNPEVRNASLNIAYHNYKAQTGNKSKTFKEFLETPITMYRGTSGQKTVSSDEWQSYTWDKKVAEKFGKNIQTIKIKPKDTFGSMQTTGEVEVLIPNFML